MTTATPSLDRPVHVFYTPHADDETLGMGAAIAQASLDGARVVVVLVTDNRPSPRAVELFSDRLRCPWHQGQKHDLGHIDLHAARLVEFRDAVAALGADEVAQLDIPETLGLADHGRYVAAMHAAIVRYAVQYPGATHHVVQSVADYHQDSGLGHMSHSALAEAAHLARAEIGPFWLHRVYIYSRPLAERHATVIIGLSPEAFARKRAALRAYEGFDPAWGRIAYGYHSVPELFMAAAADPHEYMEIAE